jgi:TolA-binding protein
VAPVASELVVPETTAEAPMVPVVMPPVESASSLFEAAAKARNAGDYGRAITLHKKLETTYPQSREADASYATLGRLLLDRGDATGALAAFDAYQAKGPGPLDEAVLVGRATSLERLGRDADARAVWTQLLRDFPDTPYREHAESKTKQP